MESKRRGGGLVEVSAEVEEAPKGVQENSMVMALSLNNMICKAETEGEALRRREAERYVAAWAPRERLWVKGRAHAGNARE